MDKYNRPLREKTGADRTSLKLPRTHYGVNLGNIYDGVAVLFGLAWIVSLILSGILAVSTFVLSVPLMTHKDIYTICGASLALFFVFVILGRTVGKMGRVKKGRHFYIQDTFQPWVKDRYGIQATEAESRKLLEGGVVTLNDYPTVGLGLQGTEDNVFLEEVYDLNEFRKPYVASDEPNELEEYKDAMTSDAGYHKDDAGIDFLENTGSNTAVLTKADPEIKVTPSKTQNKTNTSRTKKNRKRS